MTVTLLGLPTELRCHIYGYIFAGQVITIRNCSTRTGRGTEIRGGIANILFVSKITYKEVLPILYESCAFCFRYNWAMSNFLREHTSQLQDITHVNFKHNPDAVTEPTLRRSYGDRNIKKEPGHNQANYLVNLKSLNLELLLSPASIAPICDLDDWLFHVEDMDDLDWLLVAKTLCNLNGLKHVNLTVTGLGHEELTEQFERLIEDDLFQGVVRKLAGASTEQINEVYKQW